MDEHRTQKMRQTDRVHSIQIFYTSFSPCPVLYDVILSISLSLMMCLSVSYPHPAIVTFSVGFPLLVPHFSIFSTTA